MKLVLILIVCCLIIFIFYKVFCYYRSRQYFFENLCEFCESFNSEISFLKNNLNDILEKQKNCYKKDFNLLLNDYQTALKLKDSFNKHFSKSLDKLAILKQDEKDKINMFFSMLGRTNVLDQKSQIASFKQNFERHKQNAIDETKKYGEMNIKLGIICAIAVFIIFI